MNAVRQKVFLSSTKVDLIAERSVVYWALTDLYQVVRMEDFGADTRSSWEKCAAALTDCDIYLLLLGHQYGSELPDSGLSYTEAEYELAQIHGLPTFAYIKAGFESEWSKASEPLRLKDFYNRVTEAHQVAFFRGLDELAGQVRQDLANWDGSTPIRPTFHAHRRALSDPTSYAIAVARRELVEENDPYVIYIADLQVAEAQDYPVGHSRRIGNKAIEVRNSLQRAGAKTLLLNEIEAYGPSPEEILRRRAEIACCEADAIVVLISGDDDLPRLALFQDFSGVLAIRHFDRVTLENRIPTASYQSFDFVALNRCTVASELEKFLERHFKEHATKLLTPTA